MCMCGPLVMYQGNYDDEVQAALVRDANGLTVPLRTVHSGGTEFFKTCESESV